MFFNEFLETLPNKLYGIDLKYQNVFVRCRCQSRNVQMIFYTLVELSTIKTGEIVGVGVCVFLEIKWWKLTVWDDLSVGSFVKPSGLVVIRVFDYIPLKSRLCSHTGSSLIFVCR